MARIVVGCFLLLALLACEPGLTPEPDVEPGFGGTVTFAPSTWPRADSLFNLWIFASKIYPLDSTKVFTGLFSDPPAIFLYPAIDRNLPFNVDSVSYSFAVPPGTYLYVGVLQRFREEISVRSLRVVGVYTASGDPSVASPVTVLEHQFVVGIDIRVNFHNPPPQPF